ncbi:DNA-binding protein [Brevibacillus laterosporus]|uniref:CvfB family protein n=1 Tax=Brevibacillus laterosporus TaxID=1465 RepID=UPI000C758B7F|nr:S1-like domain-containing RNA-binding protein [Brevibacillus laterosporus]AUM63656.1 DNA-binding protein [Brevibacillus laterosporus]
MRDKRQFGNRDGQGRGGRGVRSGGGSGRQQGGRFSSPRAGYRGDSRNASFSEKTMPAQSTKYMAGTIVSLPVSRVEEYGYFLTDGDVEILLHQNEATDQLEVGDTVKVFLYHDHENRLAATMQMPLVREGEYQWLDVVDVSTRVGVFLHNGIQKDLLVFKDDLPMQWEEWPQVGDKLLVTLKRDKHGRLLGEPASENVIWDLSRNATSEMKNKWVEGIIYRVFMEGVFVFTDDKHILFIHEDEMTESLRMGQRVRARVSYVREDGRLNGSMQERKEVRYGIDAQILLGVLKERGAMPYTDKSTPEEIKDRFNMSKASFKRAMGKLMKEGLVEQVDGWTHLKKEVYMNHQRELEENMES